MADDRSDTWRDELRDLPDAMHTTPELSAILSGRGRVQRMLDVEAALARAQARAGVIEHDIAERIAAGAARLRPDIPSLSEASAVAGAIALPVVSALRDAVDEDARRAVHLGATSQDIIDTATILQVRDALSVMLRDLLATGEAAEHLAQTHRLTPMVGRTLLQQAVPVTFGLKAAGWLAGIDRQLHALDRLRTEVLALQFGGAAGTLASLGDAGLQVMELLGEELDLTVPALPWHGERSRIGEVAGTLATTSGVLAKIATDIVLLMQNEVAEVTEGGGAGKGKSSTMPNKTNPVETMAILAGDRLAQAQAGALLAAIPQQHERAIGPWQAEWTALPACVRLVGGSIARAHVTLRDLHVHPDRMHHNLDADGGFPMAESLATQLTDALGKPEAYRIIADLCASALDEGRHLRDVARADERVTAVLDDARITSSLEPDAYLGQSGAFVDRAVAAFQATRADLTG